MARSETLALIRQALHDVDPDHASRWASIELDTSIDSLGLDSIRLLELVNSIEEAADTVFPEEALPEVRTLADLANLAEAS